MKFSTALVAVAAIAGGSSAFQSPAVTTGRTLNNKIMAGNTALMAATMDGTDVAAAVNGQMVNGKRKKTKQVSFFSSAVVGVIEVERREFLDIILSGVYVEL